MKHRLSVLIIVLTAFACLAGCAPAPLAAQPPAVQANPADLADDPYAQVVLKMVERLNAGDIDGSLAYFAGDALSYFVGMPPTGMEFYDGAEALRPTWEFCVSDHFEWELEITNVEGEFVYANARTWLDFTRQLGVAPNEFTEVYQVRDGKIVTYGSTMTEAALAKFKPAFYEAVPPEPAEAPPAVPPASEMTVTLADGTCTTDVSGALQAGDVSVIVNVEDQGKPIYAVTLFSLEDGKDMLDLMASTVQDSPPSWTKSILMKEYGPGESEAYSLTLKEGQVYLVCWSKPPALPIGNAGPFDVVPVEDTPPAPVRGESDVMVTFADKQCSYEGPAVLPGGDVKVIMNMQGQDPYKTANGLMFFTLESGYDLDDLVDSIWMPAPPDWSRMIFFHEAYPGEAAEFTLSIEAGPLYYVCLSGEAEDTAILVGKGGPMEVSP